MSENDDPDVKDPEPNLVVDSDWKEQVAKEKEQARAQATKEGETDADKQDFVAKAEPVSKTERVSNSEPAESEDIPPPPPATFEILISMMFTQALSMLGQIPDPSGQTNPVNKPYAKHTIDTLEMLGEKTKGNLTEDESNMLSEALHALRMAYVNTRA